jgi:hypothetical protein
MQISREHFIGQFWPPVQVQALKLWHLRSKEPPEHMPGAIYKAIQVCAGIVSVDVGRFHEIVEPVIANVHRTTPKGQRRPEARRLLGLVYDALDAAGVEIGIKPPLQPHGRRGR